MGVEVIHHQNDSLGVGVVEVNQLSYAMCPLDLRPPPLGDADVAPAGQGLTDDEEVGRPIALVLVVVAGGSSRGGGKRFPHLAHELLALLVQAHLRETLVVGAGVDRENVLHAPDELGASCFGGMDHCPLSQGLRALF